MIAQHFVRVLSERMVDKFKGATRRRLSEKLEHGKIALEIPSAAE